jgi:hypothetical protein
MQMQKHKSRRLLGVPEGRLVHLSTVRKKQKMHARQATHLAQNCMPATWAHIRRQIDHNVINGSLNKLM